MPQAVVVAKPSFKIVGSLDGPQATLPGIDLRQATLKMTFCATWRYDGDPLPMRQPPYHGTPGPSATLLRSLILSIASFPWDANRHLPYHELFFAA